MNQYTINHYYPMSDIEKKMLLLSQKFSRLHIKEFFEQLQKKCMEFFKNLWSDINIENHCNATNSDPNTTTKTADIQIPETINTHCLDSLNESLDHLSVFEELFLSNYSLAMNDFGDTKIKESYSDFAQYL